MRPQHEWDATEAKKVTQAKAQKRRCNSAIDAELAWLSGQCAEPRWPSFPSEGARGRRRRRFRIGGPQEEVPRPPPKRADEFSWINQGAALWLSRIARPISADNRTWILDVAKAYATWTYDANGAGLPEEQEVANPPREWNEIYFAVLAHCLPGLDEAAVDRLVWSRSLRCRTGTSLMPSHASCVAATKSISIAGPLTTPLPPAYARGCPSD